MSKRQATATVRVTAPSTIKNVLDNGTVVSASVGTSALTGGANSGRLSSGSETQEINRAWEEVISISSGNTVDLDLYDFAGRDIGAGSGNDSLGQALIMEEIVLLQIKHNGRTTANGSVSTENAGSLELQPANPSNPLSWFPSQTVANGGALRTGGVFFRYEPDGAALEVTDASSHQIRLGANGGDVRCTLTILGRSVDEESSSSLSSTSSTLSTTTQSTLSSRSGTSASSLSTTSQSTQSFG